MFQIANFDIETINIMNMSANQSSRVILLLAICSLAIFVVMAFTNESKSSTAVNSSGVPMTFVEFNEAKSAWSVSHPVGATLGGNISKSDLLQIINAAPLDSNISFYFGSDAKGKTFVMFAPTAAKIESKIIRNAAFCPNSCD